MKYSVHAVLSAGCVLGACALESPHRSNSSAMETLTAEAANASPEKLQDGIAVGSLDAAKLDPVIIASGIRAIEGGDYGNIHSLLIFRRGSLVSESYFAGNDWNNHVGSIGLVEYSRETLHDVRSISKSVVALAVLIAHEQSDIASLDQPLFEFFPEYEAAYSDTEKAQITLRHALTMTAGLDWDETVPYTSPDNDGSQLALASDPIEFVLSRKLAAPPGEKFNYNGGLTQLLAAVVERSTGSDVDTFARRNLLSPLGIQQSEWAKRRDGKPDADSGLRLRSRDLAKIGLLFADRGRWNGAQILSEQLMEEAVAPHIVISQETSADGSDEQLAYGYQTWLFSFPADGKTVRLIELSGNGGQKVYVDRERELMIVITAGNYDRFDLPKSPIDIYFDIVEPAILDR